jgi:NitT/TauT family transport system ATP-binding protein
MAVEKSAPEAVHRSGETGPDTAPRAGEPKSNTTPTPRREGSGSDNRDPASPRAAKPPAKPSGARPADPKAPGAELSDAKLSEAKLSEAKLSDAKLSDAKPPGAEPGPPALEFTGVGMRFGATVALTPLDFSVAPGEFVAVVGPSGCGKCTQLRIAAGLSTPTSGRAAVRAEQVGYVFQDATLLPWRGVRRNVELLAELAGVGRAERRARAEEAIRLVGLAGFEKHRPRALSGGMRMRVSIARALTLSPDLFLFDEPFGALDEITRERLNDELLRLYGERPFAAVFVTHSVAEAVYLAQRVVVMSDRPGRVLGEFTVPFPYPRRHSLRYTDEFTALAAEVSRRLRGGDA